MKYMYVVVKSEYDTDLESTAESIAGIYSDSDDAFTYVDEQRDFGLEDTKYRVDRHRVL